MADTMPTIGDALTRTATCDADLSSLEGYAVNLDTTDEHNVNLAADASAVPYPLVSGADGSASKKLVTYAYGGRAYVKLGGTVAPGDKLTSDGSGKWIKTTTDTDNYGAVANEIGAANDLIEAEIVQGMIAG